MILYSATNGVGGRSPGPRRVRRQFDVLPRTPRTMVDGAGGEGQKVSQIITA